jgi:hypothetical protein
MNWWIERKDAKGQGSHVGKDGEESRVREKQTHVDRETDLGQPDELAPTLTN